AQGARLTMPCSSTSAVNPCPTGVAANTAVPANDALGNPIFQNGVYDPKTQVVAPDGSIVKLQYAGNRIPLTDMDPTAKIIQALIPLPTSSGLINNYAVPAYTNLRHTEIPSIKIDHNLSSTIKVAGYYSATRTYSPQANGYTQA